MKRWLFVAVFLLWCSVPARADVTCIQHVDSTTPGGTGSGLNWTDARPGLNIDWSAVGNPGDIICVSDESAESYAVVTTITGESGLAADKPAVIVCVDESGCTGSVCPLCDVGGAEFATFTTTTGGDAIQFEGRLYIYGVYFYSEDSVDIGSAVSSHIVLEECRLELTSGQSADAIELGNTNSGKWTAIEIINTDIDFSGVAMGLRISGGPTLIDGGTWEYNTNNVVDEFGGRSSGLKKLTIRNMDFSVMQGNLVLGSAADDMSNHISFERCSIHANATLVSGVPSRGTYFSFSQMQSGSVTDPPYQFAEYSYNGTIQSSVVNVRTGGSSDGTTNFAWEFDTNAGSSYMELYEPLCSRTPMVRWVPGGSQLTATIYVSGPAGMYDDDIWLNWSLPPSDATSLGVRESDRALPGTLTALTSDGDSTWTSGTKYKIARVFTPAEDGFVMAWPCVATDTSTTKVYFDAPFIDIQ